MCRCGTRLPTIVAMGRLASLLLVLAAGTAIWAGFGNAATGSRQQPAPIVAESRLASAVVARVNAIRAESGLERVRLSVPLAQAAALHSREMAELGFFRHGSADGSPFRRRVDRFYVSKGFRSWRAGETLLWASPGIDARGTVDDWLRSPDHRAILLNPAWHDIGVSGVHAADAPGIFQGHDVTILTADFGFRSG